jgi:hypothetical protein
VGPHHPRGWNLGGTDEQRACGKIMAVVLNTFVLPRVTHYWTGGYAPIGIGVRSVMSVMVTRVCRLRL